VGGAEERQGVAGLAVVGELATAPRARAQGQHLPRGLRFKGRGRKAAHACRGLLWTRACPTHRVHVRRFLVACAVEAFAARPGAEGRLRIATFWVLTTPPRGLDDGNVVRRLVLITEALATRLAISVLCCPKASCALASRANMKLRRKTMLATAGSRFGTLRVVGPTITSPRHAKQMPDRNVLFKSMLFAETWKQILG
jgi:hypothetical protein